MKQKLMLKLINSDYSLFPYFFALSILHFILLSFSPHQLLILMDYEEALDENLCPNVQPMQLRLAQGFKVHSVSLFSHVPLARGVQTSTELQSIIMFQLNTYSLPSSCSVPIPVLPLLHSYFCNFDLTTTNTSYSPKLTRFGEVFSENSIKFCCGTSHYTIFTLYKN